MTLDLKFHEINRFNAYTENRFNMYFLYIENRFNNYSKVVTLKNRINIHTHNTIECTIELIYTENKI